MQSLHWKFMYDILVLTALSKKIKVFINKQKNKPVQIKG